MNVCIFFLGGEGLFLSADTTIILSFSALVKKIMKWFGFCAIFASFFLRDLHIFDPFHRFLRFLQKIEINFAKSIDMMMQEAYNIPYTARKRGRI